MINKKLWWSFLFALALTSNVMPMFVIVPIEDSIVVHRWLSFQEIRALINQGVDVKNCTYGEMPICHFAAFFGYSEILQLLVDAGVDVNQTAEDDFSALHLAASRGNVEFVEKLLVAGAKVNCRDAKKRTPMHFAAHVGHLAVVKALLRAGASIDVTDHGGRMPITLAVLFNHKPMITLLSDALECGHEVLDVIEKTNNDNLQSDSCPICLERFSNGVQCATLDCGHDFCLSCIIEWGKKSDPIDPRLLDRSPGAPECPLCRKSIVNFAPENLFIRTVKIHADAIESVVNSMQNMSIEETKEEDSSKKDQRSGCCIIS